MVGENLRIDMRKARPSSDGELGDLEVSIIKGVAARKSVKQIAQDIEPSEKTLYKILKGLYGERKNVPKKYQYEKTYLTKIQESNQSPIEYTPNENGWAVIATGEVPYKSEKEEQKLPEGDRKEAYSDALLRPHYKNSKHEIRRKPENWGEDSFQVRMQETDIKEADNGHGIKVHWQGYKAELYEESVVIRMDFPTEQMSVSKHWGRYWELRDRFIDYLEQRFPVRISTTPVMVEDCMSTQHWAWLQNQFSDMVVANPERFGDEENGVLFMVRNEREEPVALIDCSEGNAEMEWVHTAEAKNHIDNMKDLIMWGSYYEITPKDFKDLAWLRQNIDTFNQLLEASFTAADERSEIREHLDVVDKRISDVAERVDAVSERQSGISETQQDLEQSIEQVGTLTLNTRQELHTVHQDLRVDINDNLNHLSSLEDGLQSVQNVALQNNREVRRHQDVLENHASLIEDSRRVVDGHERLIRQHSEFIEGQHDFNRKQTEISQQHADMIQDLYETRYRVRARKMVQRIARSSREIVKRVEHKTRKNVKRVSQKLRGWF